MLHIDIIDQNVKTNQSKDVVEAWKKSDEKKTRKAYKSNLSSYSYSIEMHGFFAETSRRKSCIKKALFHTDSEDPEATKKMGERFNA